MSTTKTKSVRGIAGRPLARPAARVTITAGRGGKGSRECWSGRVDSWTRGHSYKRPQHGAGQKRSSDRKIKGRG
ncbi:hypothetical protein K461DRAFT_118166 [Myriangium duriaei CBS 260.36]|uniref:Uncharacterized protein n=1 Tax=Myriangium duriaei CBS 260.36 TaxID=1168546 RepID=A0A9P4J7Q5_9PEZI|nr:hypothetical protein K461DRAFT_118166 [Myriangium duriaei CBS 260.36]